MSRKNPFSYYESTSRLETVIILNRDSYIFIDRMSTHSYFALLK